MDKNDERFMLEAIKMAEFGMDSNAGGPFGAVVVKDGKIISKGFNKVTSTNDPTAHAEIIAIREASKKLNSFTLDGCILYTSCEPCPMCLGAIYWARPKKVFYACTKHDAAEIDFDDRFIYDELAVDIGSRKIEFTELLRESALPVFKKWESKTDKTRY